MLNGESGLIAFFLVLIVISAVFFFFSKNEKWLISAPSILTTLGISCTFVGMTVALVGFSNFNASNGLDKLFSGIKLAFIPSSTAIVLALLLKVLAIKRQDHGPNDLYLHLEMNNRYLHSLLNHYIPGFSLPPEDKPVLETKKPVNRFKKFEFDYGLLNQPDVFLIINNKENYCLVLRADEDMQHSKVLQKIAKSYGRQIIENALKSNTSTILDNGALAKFLYKNTVINDELAISLPKIKALTTLAKNESDVYCLELINELKGYKQ